jgi:hypothetical protein
MYRELLESIGGVAVFPVISLALFVVVFTLVLVVVSRLTPSRLAELAQLPFDKGEDQ